MQGFNQDQTQIQIFSRLIDTILSCRLRRRAGLAEDIRKILDKLNEGRNGDGVELDEGLGVINKLHEGCEFRVHSVLQKHFQDHSMEKFSIYLQIFTLHNKQNQQHNTSHFYQPHKRLTQKWVFLKDPLIKRRLNSMRLQNRSDLLQQILATIKCLNLSQQESQNANNQLLEYNTTADDDIINKSYQIVIKSKCIKKDKFVTHVFHHQRNNHQPSLHTMHMKTSLPQFNKYWEKTLFFDSLSSVTTVGCYSKKKNATTKTPGNHLPHSVNIGFLRQPDRKLSSETKQEEKAKSSTSSFKFSLQNFPFSLNLNLSKGIKHGSAQLPTRKPSQQILQNHRPRYQSIYESRDEEMNIFILSPRKLSDQQSPKARHLQQKTIKFEIGHHNEHFSQGISEQMIEEFVLEPDENMSNVSSDGFEMLWDEGDVQMDKFKQGQTNTHAQIILQQIAQLEAAIINSLRAFDNGFLFV